MIKLRNLLNENILDKDAKTEHFSVKFGEPDLCKGAGKIFLNGNIWFANTIKLEDNYGPKYGGKWIINAHTGAFKLNFKSPSVGFDTVSDLLNYLEEWYIKTI